MSPSDLLARLRSAGDPLQILAADALTTAHAEAKRLRERVTQLEAIARLNGETIRAMQRAAAEAEREQYLPSGRRQPRSTES